MKQLNLNLQKTQKTQSNKLNLLRIRSNKMKI